MFLGVGAAGKALAFDLNTFTFNGHTLRTVILDGKPWFALLDVLSVLGLGTSNAFNYTRRYLSQGEWALTPRKDFNDGTPFKLNGVKAPREAGSSLTIITEGGLYKIIMRAQRKNPAAREVQDWVTKEVIPRIRKDGGYIMGGCKYAVLNKADAEKTCIEVRYMFPPAGDGR